MVSCIFCNIINGTIPSEKVYEDEHVYAFMDITPVAKGHLLLIPKVHRENVYDMTEDEAANLFRAVPKIANALKAEFQPAGMNLLQNNGSHAGQTVYHFHLHFIPRYDEKDGFDWTWNPQVDTLTPEVIGGLASQLRERL